MYILGIADISANWYQEKVYYCYYIYIYYIVNNSRNSISDFFFCFSEAVTFDFDWHFPRVITGNLCVTCELLHSAVRNLRCWHLSLMRLFALELFLYCCDTGSTHHTCLIESLPGAASFAGSLWSWHQTVMMMIIKPQWRLSHLVLFFL